MRRQSLPHQRIAVPNPRTPPPPTHLTASLTACQHARTSGEIFPMLTIAVVSQKGGSGKTTLALNLAIAAEGRRKRAAVIDLDPQGSATAWGQARQTPTPIVLPARPFDLDDQLESARSQRARLVLIDTAPHAEQPALVAARAADLILIPCRASILDLRAITLSQDIAALARVPAAAVLVGIPARGTIGDEADAALRSRDLEVAPVRIGHRIEFVHAATAAAGVLETQPQGKAAAEIRELHTWVVRGAAKLRRT